jgi:hypothetical protein
MLPTRTRAIVTIEVVAAFASLVLAGMWINNPAGPYEPFLAGTGLTFLLTELYRRYEGKIFKVEGVERTPAERVRHHDALRDIFKEEIQRCRAQKLRKDVVIRHVNRLDSYPDINESPGISPWFKVGLIDTYHKGIKVGLGWHGIVETQGGYRQVNYKTREQSDITALLTGEIPYDYIESMNVDGDEYYYLPHIFCHFANHGEPYERLFWTQEVDMGNGMKYWKEIGDYIPPKKINVGIGT